MPMRERPANRVALRPVKALPSMVDHPAGPSASRARAFAAPRDRLVLAAWSALFLNGLGFLGSSLLPVPGVLAQMIAQGSLVVAIFLAAAANLRLAIRPHPALVLLSVLAVVSLVVSLHNQFFLGSTYRAFRILGFLVALWLLTPWWGR